MNRDPLSPATNSPTDSPSSSAFTLASEEFIADDDLISHDLAVLEQLRRSVHKNLKLRPIRSSPSLPSPASVSRPSPPPSETFYELRHPPLPFAIGAYDATVPLPYDPTLLLRRLSLTTRPLLIDTRPPGSYLASRIQHSVNLAIPSLIIKRCRKPNGGFSSITTLRAFISTDRGKDIWDNLMNPAGPWNGDVVVYDEEMDERNLLTPGKPTLTSSQPSVAWILLSVLAPLVHGQTYYLRGGISAARRTAEADLRIVSGEREAVYDEDDDDTPAINISQGTSAATGLFSLRTDVAARSRTMPEIEPQSASPSLSPVRPHSYNHTTVPPDTLSVTSSWSGQSGPAIPKLDTSQSNSGPPKLSLRTGLNTLHGPKLSRSPATTLPRLRLRSVSPSNLTVAYDPATLKSPHSPPLSSPSSFHTAPRSPLTPNTLSHSPIESHTPLPPSPHTARPPQSPTSPLPIFAISTILPNFLFLGPELVLPEHVQQLKDLGVKRILNIAMECDDDLGLNLRHEFERYDRIPMRDTVEEVNVARGMQEVCDFLDDARLHSSPTYVHCKAGKSRSVTAVMAYLIHANHWTLAKAYAFVLERRRGISPNIGFVSELMNFEEVELGGKSVGVRGAVAGDSGVKTGNYGHAVTGRRQGHMRESLPPVLPSKGPNPIAALAGQMSAGVPGGNHTAVLQGQGEEMEVRDGTGRYRHARRAPVDELTLQPMRRVSKAGLESTWV